MKIEFKSKGGIYIKPKNRGSFRRWCGGNVTEECIRKGKASSNPKIRKKATFALNSRRWKHLQGGLIIALEGTKLNWTNLISNAATNILSTIAQNNLVSAEAEKLSVLNKLNWEAVKKLIIDLSIKDLSERFQLWTNDYLQGLTLDNPSDIVISNLSLKERNLKILEGELLYRNKNLLILSESNNLKASNWGNAISGILLSGAGMLANYLGKNNPTTTTNSSYNPNQQYSLMNLNPQYWTSNYGSNFKFNLKNENNI